jgi:hypothetical protein
MPRGLAWSPDGSDLFIVLVNLSLHVIYDPMRIQTTLSLTGPSVAYITKQVTLTGSLKISGGTVPAGTPITVTRTVEGGTGSKQFDVTTAADGSYTPTDTPPALGVYTYTAVYSGNTTTARAMAAHAVTVSRIPPSLTLKTGSTTYTYHPTIRVTAHLGTTFSNRTVSIYAKPFGSTTKELLKTGTVNSDGNLSVSYRAPYNTTFSVVFAGDKYYAPKTVTRAAYVKAKATESLTGYYTSETIAGHTYRLYHRSNLLHAHATVSPNKHGQCVKFEVQEHYRGA